MDHQIGVLSCCKRSKAAKGFSCLWEQRWFSRLRDIWREGFCGSPGPHWGSTWQKPVYLCHQPVGWFPIGSSCCWGKGRIIHKVQCQKLPPHPHPLQCFNLITLISDAWAIFWYLRYDPFLSSNSFCLVSLWWFAETANGTINVKCINQHWSGNSLNFITSYCQILGEKVKSKVTWQDQIQESKNSNSDLLLVVSKKKKQKTL